MAVPTAAARVAVQAVKQTVVAPAHVRGNQRMARRAVGAAAARRATVAVRCVICMAFFSNTWNVFHCREPWACRLETVVIS